MKEVLATALILAALTRASIANHFFFDQPKVYFMHNWSRGRAKDFAQAIKGTFLVAGLKAVTAPIHN